MRTTLPKRTIRAVKPGWILPAICLLLLAASAPTWANVYASEFAKTGDASISYRLNQDARTNVQIQVWEVGGDQVYSEDLGPQTKGLHNWTWNLTGGHPGLSYVVKVVAADSGYTGWTKISDDANADLCCWLPNGVTVGKDQNSPNFGKIYIGNGQAGNDHLHLSPSPGTFTGIYRVHADGVADAFGAGGVAWGTASHSMKVEIGPDNHLYMADVADDYSYEWSEDLSSTTRLNDHTNLSRYGQYDTATPPNNIGQYVNAIVVEGSQAEGNRKIYLCSNNYWDVSPQRHVHLQPRRKRGMHANDKGTILLGPGTGQYYRSYYPWDIDRDANGDWYTEHVPVEPRPGPAACQDPRLGHAPPDNRGVGGRLLASELSWARRVRPDEPGLLHIVLRCDGVRLRQDDWSCPGQL